jgi:hypothetical protein
MFRWDREKTIDLACIPEITVAEVAARLGTSVSSVEKFYNRHRAELYAARNETSVSDATYSKVMELWGDQYTNEEISRKTGLSRAVVRRLILIAEIEEAPTDQGASLELLALMTEHPSRMYEDDVRALTECSYGQPRLLGYGGDCVMPFSEEKTWLPQRSTERAVTLARAA